MLNKKGVSVWVSAVLYFGIGIVIIAIILSAGMPVVDRIRDKNIATQTKTVFFNLDKVVKEVAKEGPGSQRVVTLELQKGAISFDTNQETSGSFVIWNYSTTAVLSEPSQIVKEGPLNILTLETGTSKGYELIYSLNYTCTLILDIDPSLLTAGGTRELLVNNPGTSKDVNCGSVVRKLPIISVKEL